MKYVVVVAASVTLFATHSYATERYWSLAAGSWQSEQTSTVDYNFHEREVEYDPGWGLGGTLGAAFDNGLRLENEVVYRQTTAKGTADDVWVLGWLVNIWLDARNSSRFTPYIGGGFGLGRGHIGSPGPVDNSGYGIEYQTGGGVGVRVNTQLSLDFGYRYFGITDTYSGNGLGSFNLAGSSLMTGLRCRF